MSASAISVYYPVLRVVLWMNNPCRTPPENPGGSVTTNRSGLSVARFVPRLPCRTKLPNWLNLKVKLAEIGYGQHFLTWSRLEDVFQNW